MAANDSKIDENSYSIKNAYVIFCFCYQIGTFTSRSLLEMMKTSRIGILTFLQIINFAFGFSNSYWFYLKNQYALFAWMVFIGLLGGSSYSNVTYLLINSDKLKKNEKELSTTMLGLSIEIACLLASLFSVLLSNTLFKATIHHA